MKKYFRKRFFQLWFVAKFENFSKIFERIIVHNAYAFIGANFSLIFIDNGNYFAITIQFII